MISIGLVGFLWHVYKDVVSGLLLIATLIVGLFHMARIKKIIISLYRRKFNVIKKEWHVILIFVYILLVNLLRIYRGTWESLFIDITEFEDLFTNVIAFMFISYVFSASLTILGYVVKLLDKVKKKIFKKLV